jgi:hypothetical protein
LQGKQVVPRLAELDIDLKFGLWKEYAEWVELDQYADYWHSLDVLKTLNVGIEVHVGNEPVFVQTVDTFGNIKIHAEFDDTVSENCDLRITISGLNNLLAKDDHGQIVCGMFQIESVKIQGIGITHMLDNTRFSSDVDVVVAAMTRPIYSWMIKNHSQILRAAFDLPNSLGWQR